MTWTCQTDTCPIRDTPQPNPPGKAWEWWRRHWMREHYQPGTGTSE